jgi:hypothetical protein
MKFDSYTNFNDVTNYKWNNKICLYFRKTLAKLYPGSKYEPDPHLAGSG